MERMTLFQIACLTPDAVAIWRQLSSVHVLASKLPFRQRHKTLLGLRYRIADMERTGERVSKMAIESASPLVDSVDDSLKRINQRLDHVDEARGELRELGGNA